MTVCILRPHKAWHISGLKLIPTFILVSNVDRKVMNNDAYGLKCTEIIQLYLW